MAEERVRVVCRVRPAAPGESRCVTVSGPTEDEGAECLTLHMPKSADRAFTFDHVVDEDVSQDAIFQIIKPVAENCIKGYHGTIFAYGQTGSGKTFTMMGPVDQETGLVVRELRGIIPRTFEYIFGLLEDQRQKMASHQHIIKCSYLEIYNEQIFDLLDAASSNLHLREEMKRGVFVDGLTEVPVVTPQQALDVFSRGHRSRRVAETSMNRESSRSHA